MRTLHTNIPTTTASFLIRIVTLIAIGGMGLDARAQTDTAPAITEPIPTWSVGVLLTMGVDPASTMEPALEEGDGREPQPTWRVEVGRQRANGWFLMGAAEYGVQRHGGVYHAELVGNSHIKYSGDLIGVQHTTVALQPCIGRWTGHGRAGLWRRFLFSFRAGLSLQYVHAWYGGVADKQVQVESGAYYSTGDDEAPPLGNAVLGRWDELEPFAKADGLGLGALLAVRMEMRLVKGLALVMDLGGQVSLLAPRFGSLHYAPAEINVEEYRLNLGAFALGGGLCYRF